MKKKHLGHIISVIRVNRIDNHRAQISWETKEKNNKVYIYMGDSPGSIDRSAPVSVVTGAGRADVCGLSKEVRPYFEVVANGFPSGVIVAERRIFLEGAANFRDLGGYETIDGHRVKWGRVYRTNNLSKLTDSDMALFKQMGIKLVCDFRVPGEKEKEPDRIPDDGSVKYLSLPIVHGEIDTVAATQRIRNGDLDWLTDEFMIDGYKKNIDNFADIWGTVIYRLSEPENCPLAFHCNVGKDRAGTCAAIILLMLGVPEETIRYDYGLSNIFLADWVEAIKEAIRDKGTDPERLLPFMVASPKYIDALLEHIREKYGNVENYITTRAGVTRDTISIIKEKLLE
jgi:protein-tyrosine phosphatase